jgi:hypothetical protein
VLMHQSCASAGCALFQNQINERTLESIRQTTSRAWVPGNDRFKAETVNCWIDRRRQQPGAATGNRQRIASSTQSIESDPVGSTCYDAGE